jgi:F-type H+-transporting ATPase subunit c
MEAMNVDLIGAGLVIIGAGIGLGTGKIQTAMIIIAALLEGVAFAALFAV